MGRADLQIRCDSQWNPQLDFRGNWPGMSASVSARVECEHEHLVIIDSLVDLRSQTRASDLFAGGRTWSFPCRIIFSMLLQPHLQEIMNVYLHKRKYAAKASGKPKRLSYFQSWLLSDTF